MSSVRKDLVVDTHPFVFWLLNPSALSGGARHNLGAHAVKVHVPVMVLLEAKYLIEIGRIEADIHDMIGYVNRSHGWSVAAFDENVLLQSLSLDDHRDPFDRAILATARALGLPLLTRDRWMASRYDPCFW